MREFDHNDELGQHWDRFWERNPDAAALGAATTDILIPLLQRRRARDVLCVGNGKSLEAHALAAAGFDVDVLDVSPAATRFLAALSPSKEALARVLSGSWTQPPATLTLFTGDARNMARCPGPYDAVIMRRTLQYYTGTDAFHLLDTLRHRLCKTGLLVLEDQNSREALRTAATWLRNRQIPTAHNVIVRNGQASAPPPLHTHCRRQVAWLIRSTG